MLNTERLAEKLFGIIKGVGYRLKMYDESGNSTVDPTLATRFFIPDPGFMVTINTGDNEIQFSKGHQVSLDETDSLQKNIKNLANEFLLNYTVKLFGKSIVPKDFSYQVKSKKEENMGNISEASIGKMFGSKKTSYQQLEDVKVLVKHKKPVDEEVRGSRSRHIQSIFLERGGERFKFPHNNLSGARAMARHMYHGGGMTDQVGSYIIEATEQLIELSQFHRYVTTNNLINEDTTDIVITIKENISNIKHDLKKLTGSKTYESFKSYIESREVEDLNEDNIDQYKELFTVKHFDEKFNNVLPIVNKLVSEKNNYLRKVEEAARNVIQLTPEKIEINDAIAFESELAKFGFMLSEMSNRIIENKDLSSFVSTVGKKLATGKEISAFESEIILNVLKNSSIQELKEENKDSEKELKESIEFVNFFDRYNYQFL